MNLLACCILSAEIEVFKFRKALIKTLFSLGKYICKANNTVTVLQPRDIVSYHI